jgi:hypothetical protein
MRRAIDATGIADTDAAGGAAELGDGKFVTDASARNCLAAAAVRLLTIADDAAVRCGSGAAAFDCDAAGLGGVAAALPVLRRVAGADDGCV